MNESRLLMVPCRNRRNCCQTAKMSHTDRLSQKHTLPKLTDQSRVCVNDFSTIFPICVSCLLIPLSSCTCLILCGRGLCVKCPLCVSKATLCIFKCITDFFVCQVLFVHVTVLRLLASLYAECDRVGFGVVKNVSNCLTSVIFSSYFFLFHFQAMSSLGIAVIAG